MTTTSFKVAVTCGDPAGIGPEIALKAAHAYPDARALLLVGPEGVWAKASALVSLPWRDFSWRETAGDEAVAYGAPSKVGGQIARAALDGAIAAALSGEVQAVVTAPVAKASLHAAGLQVPGQTEYFAAESKVESFAMMLSGGGINAVLVSTHLALAQAIAELSVPSILKCAQVAERALRRQLGRAPRLALAALNPHAGENGKFGDEEARILTPAVRAAQQQGIDLSGPHPADTLFFQARTGLFDAVIALYHDQGAIAVKTLAFDEGVNVTLGLPFVRTSPDHGTAFDIAGQGIARPNSMSAALNVATQWVEKSL